MFVYSNMHAWQRDPSLQQVLVFSSQQMKDEFEKTYSVATQKHDPKLVKVVSENNMGAVYKLRAAKNRSGKWQPIIRCGFTGYLLANFGAECETPEEAIQICKIHMKNAIDTTL